MRSETITLRPVNTFVGFSPVAPSCSSVGATQPMQTTGAFPQGWGFARRVRKWAVGRGGAGCLEESVCNDGPRL